MKGISLEFKTKVETSKDALNNPVYSLVSVTVPNCLIAPSSVPTSAAEQQAIDQSKDTIVIHIPKTFKDDISGSYVAWGGKIFHVLSSSVPFMDENTPGQWDRYFNAECVGDYDNNDDLNKVILKFIVTEDSKYYISGEN